MPLPSAADTNAQKALDQKQPAAVAEESFRAKALGTFAAHPPFTRYMAGTAVSLTGTWMQAAAQGYVLATLTTEAKLLGLVNLASGLPMLLLTFKGGSFADKHDKRVIMLVTQVVQIILAALLGWLVLTQQVTLWHVVAIASVLGIAAAFEVPADSALIPELVNKERIGVAIAIDRSLFHATRLIGPAVAGLLIAAVGTASAFFINAFSFLGIIIAVLTLAPRVRGTAEEEQKRAGGMKDGIAYVRGDKPTLSMIGLLASSTLFVSPIFIVMMPIYVTHELHLGADKLGYLMSCSGIGSLTGALGLLSIPPEKRLSRMRLASAGAVLATLGFGLSPNFWVAAICMMFMSLCLSNNFGLANTIVQERAPDHLRGRVSALAGLSFFGLMPFAGLGITSLADAIGMRPAIVVGAVCYGIAAMWVLFGPGRRIYADRGAPAENPTPENLMLDPEPTPGETALEAKGA